MAQNEFLLDMDLKFIPSFVPPRFRRGDTAILKFRLHDNGVAFDFADLEKAEVTIEMPSKITLKDNASIKQLDGRAVVVFQFAPIHMVEVGNYTIYLTIIKGDNRVSTTPITVRFYDNLTQETLGFLTVIEDLHNEIKGMELKLADGINMSEKGKPNGVASLDANGNLLTSEIPTYMDDHINSKFCSDNGVHGLRITKDGVPLYKDKDGAWNNVIFSDTPVGGGVAPHTPPKIDVGEGIVVIDFPDKDVPAIQKWDTGEHDIDWFKDHGYPFTGSGFKVTTAGTYTYYYKLNDNREFVVVFAVTEAQLPAKPTKPTKPISELPDGTLVKIGDQYWQVLDAKKGFLWFADAYPVRFTMAYDESMPRNTRTRNFDTSKVTHSANMLNNDFFNTLPVDFRNAIKDTSWNNGTDGNEGSYKVTAKLGYLTASEWTKYRDMLEYVNAENYETFSYTITKSPTNDERIFVYADNFKKQARLEEYDVFQYYNSDGVNNIANARAVVYADPNFKVEVEDKNDELLAPIESFNEGDTIKFANINWILVDKATRKLIARDPVAYDLFDTDYAGKGQIQFEINKPTNIGYYLNVDFYNKLPVKDRGNIAMTTWDVADLGKAPDNRINARIGLLNAKEATDKRSVLTPHFDKAKTLWLITDGTQNGHQTLYPMPDNMGGGAYKIFGNIQPDLEANIHPVLCLNAGTMVSAVVFSKVAVSTLETGAYINFGGREWIHMGEGNFVTSRVLTKSAFMGEFEEGSAVYSLTKGLGRWLNYGDYNLLYIKDQGKAQSFAIDVGTKGSSSVYSTMGLVSSAKWKSGYRDILMRLSRDDEPYWFSDNPSIGTSYVYAYSRGGSYDSIPDVTAFSYSAIQGIRPMIKLKLTELVEIENNIDKNGYAFIPDVELRKIINRILGKGEGVSTKITIAEMYSITEFDTYDLGKVSDLTGVELLVNATKFRATLSDRGLISDVLFTDVAPFVQLGKSKKLKNFTLYGVPNNKHNKDVLDGIKGKFPNIDNGYVSDIMDAIWIDTWELKGVIGAPRILRNSLGYAYYNGDTPETAGMYSISFRVVDNSNDIIKWKPFNETAYKDWFVDWGSEQFHQIDKNQIYSMRSQLLFKYDETTKDGKWTIGFENKAGVREELHIIVKDHMVYARYNNEPEVAMLTLLSTNKMTVGGVYNVPTTIDGATLTVLGNFDNPRMDSGYTFPVKTVNIPATVKEIYSYMPEQRNDVEIYVHNPECKFNKPALTFIKSYKGGGDWTYPTITLCGKKNSTMQSLAETRASDKNYIFKEF